MQPLEHHMGMYTAYHRHPTNRAIHFVMVPAILWSLLLALSLITFTTFGDPPFAITPALLLLAATLIWYLRMDLALGIAAVFVYTFVYGSAIAVANATTTGQSLWIAAGVFVGGWIFQFIGHGVWEKRRPALLDNGVQALIAPFFLVAETAFAMELRKDLKQRVEEVAKAHVLPSTAT